MKATTEIKPSLRFIDLTVIVMSLVIGMGIFRTPVEVANKSGTWSIFILAWIAGAIVSMIGSFIFAEIGSRFPHAGGFYKIFSHCYHPAFAFMINWITLISNAASTALVSILGAEYVAPILFPNMDHSTCVGIVSFSSVLLLYGVNLMGIKISAKILSVLMSVKVLLLVVIISGIFFVTKSTSTLVVTQVSSVYDTLGAFALCFIPVFFTYGGYQQTMNFGGDISEAKRKMPHAIIVGMTAVMVIYLTANYAYVHVLGFSELQQSDTLAADVVAIMFGEKYIPVVSIIMFLSVLAYVNVSVMSNPRVYYAMAEDGVMPAQLMRVNPKTQVQESALTLFVAFILITLLFSNSFEYLLQFVMFFDSIAFISAAAAIFIFRKRVKNQDADPSVFRMKFYPWLPIFFIAVYATITITIFVYDWKSALIGFLLFVTGYPLYLLFQRINVKKT